MNLQTDYLGLKLEHPIAASASPLSRELDGIRRLEDAGAAAVVMPSVYQEEIEAEDAAYLALVEKGSWAQPEAAEGYFPEMTAFRVGGSSISSSVPPIWGVKRLNQTFFTSGRTDQNDKNSSK